MFDGDNMKLNMRKSNIASDFPLTRAEKIIEDYNKSLLTKNLKRQQYKENLAELQNIITPLEINILDCDIDMTFDATFGYGFDNTLTILEAEIGYLLYGKDENPAQIFRNLNDKGYGSFKELYLVTVAPYEAASFKSAEDQSGKCFEWEEILQKNIIPGFSQLYELEGARSFHITTQKHATIFSYSGYDSILIEVSYSSSAWISPFDITTENKESIISKKKEKALRQIIFSSKMNGNVLPLVTSITPLNHIQNRV